MWVRSHQQIRLSAALLSMALLARPIPLQAQPENGWIGKQVITRSGSVLRGEVPADDAEQPDEDIASKKHAGSFTIYRVEQEKGQWLRLIAEGSNRKGWVQIADVIPFNEAIDRITAWIKTSPGVAGNYGLRGNVRVARNEYDEAIADYNETIRIDPADARNYVSRGNVWQGELSIYAVLIGYFAARRADRADEARKLLDEAASRCRTSAWPYQVVGFLRGELSENALTATATDNDKMTEVRCFLGLDHALKGQATAAKEHFLWVKDHGNPSFTEYTIALAELERLERKGQPGTK